jgi:hypothetical protein
VVAAAGSRRDPRLHRPPSENPTGAQQKRSRGSVRAERTPKQARSCRVDPQCQRGDTGKLGSPKALTSGAHTDVAREGPIRLAARVATISDSERGNLFGALSGKTPACPPHLPYFLPYLRSMDEERQETTRSPRRAALVPARHGDRWRRPRRRGLAARAFRSLWELSLDALLFVPTGGEPLRRRR